MNNTILLVLPNDKLGGAEQTLQLIALHLQSQFESVHVVFLKKEQVFSWSALHENVKLHFSNSSSEKGGLFYLVNQVRRISSNYNIVYTFSSHTHINGALGLLRKLHVLKTENLIVRESTMIFSRFNGLKLFAFKLFYKLGYDFTNLVICSTELMKTELLKNLPRAHKWKIKVMQNPVDLERLTHLSKDNLSNYYDEDNKFVVAAGRLIKIKGFDILIDAFRLIKDKYPNLNLVILGDGEEKENLIGIIKVMGLENRIKLLGYVENPIPFFKHAKVCVVSSLIEGFPNVLLQMMSQNDLVVSTTCAGGIDKINGLFTCPPSDVSVLAQKIDATLQLKNAPNIRNNFDSFLNKHSIINFIRVLFSSINEI